MRRRDTASVMRTRLSFPECERSAQGRIAGADDEDIAINLT